MERRQADDAERRRHGLRPDALGVSDEVVGTFSKEFREGMAGRATRLGDVGVNDPKGWEEGLGSGEAHVLLTINAQEKEDHQRALGKMRAAMEDAGGIEIVYQQDTALLKGAREHFGYADGFAQPAIEGASDAKAPGGGVLEKDGRWRALAPGEFVLGYPDEDTRDDPKRRLPPIRPQRDVHGLAQALPGRVRWAASCATPPSSTTGATTSSPRRSSGAGRTGRRSSLPRQARPELRPAARGGTTSATTPTSTAAAARSARTSAAPTRATRSASSAALTFRHRMIRRGQPYGDPLPDGAPRTTRPTAASCS